MTAPFPPDPRLPEKDSLVGPWIVQQRVGGGTNGVVFRVIHVDKPEAGSYALKLAREPFDERFERESRMLALIRHPSVPRFEHNGYWMSDEGRHYPYLVMQWVEGVTLYEWAVLHGLNLVQAVGLLAQVARALEATHEHGVHRDVKGDNVLVDAEGHAVLVDYGCCWYPYAQPLTDAAIPPGTENYRSPQLRRFRYHHRHDPDAYYEFQPSDDVYALGVTAYRLLTGRYPPPGTDPECADDPARAWPERLRAPRELEERCPALSALVLRMLSEEPEARGSAREVAEELERLLRHATPAMKLPWLERSSMQPTEKATHPGPPRWRGLREVPALRVLFAMAIAVLVVLVGLLLTRDVEQRPLAYEEPRKVSQGGDKPDAGAVGAGEGALASAGPARDAPASVRAVTREVPDRPFKGQKRPPCSSGETHINGGCWVPMRGEDPPCAAGWYEHERRCYVPVDVSVRSPTSEDPQ